MTKQERARTRNWLKARILSWATGDENILVEPEKLIFEQIRELRAQLLQNWDNNSIALGMNVKPKKLNNDGREI